MIWLLYIVFVTAMIRTSALLDCELEGLCVKHEDDKRFTCGEEMYVSLSKILPDVKTFWFCLTANKDLALEYKSSHDMKFYHRCYRNGTWYALFIAYENRARFHFFLKMSETSILKHLSTCLRTTATWNHIFASLKIHGNIILPDMPIDEDNEYLADYLQEVALDSNRITFLRNGSFSEYTQLRVLSLSYNEITIIEGNVLPKQNTLLCFNISFNNLECCSILDLTRYEYFWNKTLVYGECTIGDDIVDISDDFALRCTDMTTTDINTEAGEINTTDASTESGQHQFLEDMTTTDINTEAGEINTTDASTESGQHQFLEDLTTSVMVFSGIMVVVVSIVTYASLKLVSNKLKQVSSETNAMDNMEIMKKTCDQRLEDCVNELFNSRLSTNDGHPFNNIPPIFHQITSNNIPLGFSSRDRTLQSANNIRHTIPIAIPFTPMGYIDLSRV